MSALDDNSFQNVAFSPGQPNGFPSTYTVKIAMLVKVRCSLLRLSQNTPRTCTLILDVVDDVTEDDLFVLMTWVPGVQVGRHTQTWTSALES